MNQTLFSTTWYRVSSLRPKIRNHVAVTRHTYRGKDWYVLSDRITGKYHRISQQAWYIAGLMDGRRSLQQIWDSACSRLKESMPTQDEVIDLLTSLHRTDMLMADIPPDTEDLHDRMVKEKKRKFVHIIRSPMSIKLPLFDPDRILTFFKPLSDRLINRFALSVWLLVFLSAVVLGSVHFSELTENAADRILGAQNMLLLWFVYPCVKLLHEIGHACTIKKWNGEVHDVGIMFLVLMPIPYVDASASICLADKKKRILVDAAGIIVELFLASLALLIWLNIEPGILRSICFNVMLIASVSTLLFNGNPLLKFDAYYILSDAIEVPNLATKSSQHAGFLIKKYLLGVNHIETAAGSFKEACWLTVYAVLSFLYKVYISIRISLFIAGKFFIIGVILAIWASINMVVVPIVNLGNKIMNDKTLKGRRMAAACLAAGLVLLAGVLIFWMPFPYATNAEGVTQIQEEGIVFAGADGSLKKVVQMSGIPVKKGDLLFVLDNPDYETRLELNQARQMEYQAKLEQIGISKTSEYRIIKDEIDRLEKEHHHIMEQKNGLKGKSPLDGVFILADNEAFIGSFYKQGDAVGFVADFKKTTVQVVIHQADADLVRQRTRRIDLKFSSRIDITAEGRLTREVPAASDRLPNLALSLEGGGDIALDPSRVNDPKTFEKYFQFEIEVDDFPIQRIGERVFVKFVYEAEPLFYRVKRYVQRLFMKRFEI